jgi:hypothetical protein
MCQNRKALLCARLPGGLPTTQLSVHSTTDPHLEVTTSAALPRRRHVHPQVLQPQWHQLWHQGLQCPGPVRQHHSDDTQVVSVWAWLARSPAAHQPTNGGPTAVQPSNQHRRREPQSTH